MKVESYLNMDYLPDSEKPTFDVVLSTGHCSFNVYEMSEEDIRELTKDILDQLELYLGVFNSSVTTLTNLNKDE